MLPFWFLLLGLKIIFVVLLGQVPWWAGLSFSHPFETTGGKSGSHLEGFGYGLPLTFRMNRIDGKPHSSKEVVPALLMGLPP